jgi:uncharacterized protein
MAQKVLITGGSGLVGRRLSELLILKGFEVSWLSRNAGNAGEIKIYKWDLHTNFIDENAFKDIDHIIHLAGEGIADKKWSKERKKLIIESRVESTKLLFTYVAKLNVDLKSFVSTSAIGFYGGENGNNYLDEYSNAGKDFIAQVCQKWENEIFEFLELNIRTVCIRTGIVLDKKNGALPQLALPIKLGFGAYLGTGNQWMSWIHIDDLCEIFIKSVQDESFVGVYNGVASNPATNKVFSRAVAKQLKRWILPLYLPKFLFKILFGEMAIVVTGSSHVLCKRLSETDFQFQFRTLESALEDIYK